LATGGLFAERKTLKTISLLQPWATCVAIGLKTYDTRSWSTDYRGPLLIHASQKLTEEGRALYAKIENVLGPHPGLPPYEELPFGAILCEVRLENVQAFQAVLGSSEITVLERALGDYSAGRFAWKMSLVQKYIPELPVKGHPGLWEYRPHGAALSRNWT
jgi:hypothetical protein